MRSFGDFIHKNNLKKKAASNIKFYQFLSSIGLGIVDIFLQDGASLSDIGIVNLHPSKGTHWITYINQHFFLINLVALLSINNQKLSKFIKKRNGYCLYSEYKTQGITSKRDSYCESYCSYIIYLTKVLKIVFKPGVLNLHYQII